MTQEIIKEGKKGCPKCGSFEIEKITENLGWFLGILDIFLGDSKQRWKCKKCECEWKE